MAAEGAASPREGSVRAHLHAYVDGDPEDILRLGELLAELDRSAFGMLLLIATLPAFIPIPIGGAISGPLTMLIGAQLLIGMHRPWLPRFIANRGPHRRVLIRFDRKLTPFLARLEKLVRPRLQALLSNRFATVLTGLLLILLGLLLSLPIPLTNYLFGGLLLLFAVALLEQDGLVMLIAWVGGTVAIAVFGVLSGSLTHVAEGWIARLM
ncbi:MAG: exopolysaccharide biosynthesis protein [Xanthomonadaceae bacterium]|nr:exopolysaccharide biosynthesis protein [Xanthomonadaceae bacterium]